MHIYNPRGCTTHYKKVLSSSLQHYRCCPQDAKVQSKLQMVSLCSQKTVVHMLSLCSQKTVVLDSLVQSKDCCLDVVLVQSKD
jgi:hypothetical protein